MRKYLLIAGATIIVLAIVGGIFIYKNGHKTRPSYYIDPYKHYVIPDLPVAVPPPAPIVAEAHTLEDISFLYLSNAKTFDEAADEDEPSDDSSWDMTSANYEHVNYGTTGNWDLTLRVRTREKILAGGGDEYGGTLQEWQQDQNVIFTTQEEAIATNQVGSTTCPDAYYNESFRNPYPCSVYINKNNIPMFVAYMASHQEAAMYKVYTFFKKDNVYTATIYAPYQPVAGFQNDPAFQQLIDSIRF